VLILLLGLAVLARAHAAWAPLPVSGLAREADLVAVAQVLRTDVKGNPAFAILEIQDLLKPSATGPDIPRRVIKVRFPSPLVPPGTARFAVAEEVRYGAGERVVVFLKALPGKDQFETLRGPLGKLVVRNGKVSAYGTSLKDFIAEIRAALK